MAEPSRSTEETGQCSDSDIHFSDTLDLLHIKIPAGVAVKRLDLFYSDELILRYLPSDLIGQLGAFARGNGRAADTCFLSLFHRETLKEIFDLRTDDPMAAIKRLALIFQLT